ncbi:hypothetical protein D9M70_480960 [compost metagenome]
MGTRIQSGLRGTSSVGMIFTGMRATFSAPRSLTPTSTADLDVAVMRKHHEKRKAGIAPRLESPGRQSRLSGQTRIDQPR